MKRALLFSLVLTPLLPQPLFLRCQSFNDCCGRQLELGSLRLVSASEYVDVNVSQAKQLIDSSSDLVILDVRTLGEYESGHIQGADLIPVTELANRLGELNKEKETLVYCRTGVRSATASQILVDNGFQTVYYMLGGITAWGDAGYPTEIFRGDLNMDGIVNILDITIIASVFGTRLGSSSWNPSADLNSDDVINIIDVSLAAKNYGKTV